MLLGTSIFQWNYTNAAPKQDFSDIWPHKYGLPLCEHLLVISLAIRQVAKYEPTVSHPTTQSGIFLPAVGARCASVVLENYPRGQVLTSKKEEREIKYWELVQVHLKCHGPMSAMFVTISLLLCVPLYSVRESFQTFALWPPFLLLCLAFSFCCFTHLGFSNGGYIWLTVPKRHLSDERHRSVGPQIKFTHPKLSNWHWSIFAFHTSAEMQPPYLGALLFSAEYLCHCAAMAVAKYSGTCAPCQ